MYRHQSLGETDVQYQLKFFLHFSKFYIIAIFNDITNFKLQKLYFLFQFRQDFVALGNWNFFFTLEFFKFFFFAIFHKIHCTFSKFSSTYQTCSHHYRLYTESRLYSDIDCKARPSSKTTEGQSYQQIGRWLFLELSRCVCG